MSDPYALSASHRADLLPTRLTTEPAPWSAVGIPAEPAIPSVDVHVRVRTQVIRDVVVLEVVAGRLSEVVEVLDRAVQMALAEGPRGVVCDLSAVPDIVEPPALERLVTVGRHVRDWSGIPVAVACADPRAREALAAHPLGGHLIVTESVFSAVSLVLVTPILPVERLRLSPHPNALLASRDFIARTLFDWGLTPLVLSANLVVSELVRNSMMDAATDMQVSVAWSQRALRLSLRDGSPDLPGQPYTSFDRHGRRLTALTGLARSFGVLPTADGGKVVWAVLNAAQPTQSVSPLRPKPSSVNRRSRVLTDAFRLAKQLGEDPRRVQPDTISVSPTPSGENMPAR